MAEGLNNPVGTEMVDQESDNSISVSEPSADNNKEQTVEVLIDELRKRTFELEQANRELRRVSLYRSLFLARMSHELRTPLTSILGFSEILLEQEELTDTQRRFCRKVQDSGFQLQTSLNQLVDLSRIEAGETEVFLQEFSLRETLRDSSAAVSRMAQKQQVKVDCELEPEIGTIVSDQGKLRQILFNFIAWAVGRSPSNESVRVLVKAQRQTHIVIAISDRGEPVDKIIDVFDPLDASPAREAKIYELGVIIGRRMVDLIEGTVELRNRDSGGLEVSITLPVRPLKGQA